MSPEKEDLNKQQPTSRWGTPLRMIGCFLLVLLPIVLGLIVTQLTLYLWDYLEDVGVIPPGW